MSYQIIEKVLCMKCKALEPANCLSHRMFFKNEKLNETLVNPIFYRLCVCLKW